MENRKRVILYGKSIILGILKAGLTKNSQFEVITVYPPYPNVQQLGEMHPDVILFNKDNGNPEAAISLFSSKPGLLLIGVDSDSEDLLVLSSQVQKVQGMNELIDIVHQKDNSRIDEANSEPKCTSVLLGVEERRVP